MPKYTVAWTKTYYASDFVYIEAENKEEAKKIAEEHIGDYNRPGPKTYDPDGDSIVVLGTQEQMDKLFLAIKKEVAMDKNNFEESN
tara:strand:- start:204 stop:461 length:258 start_codon:yes stop_codon:yes gene_type:complete